MNLVGRQRVDVARAKRHHGRNKSAVSMMNIPSGGCGTKRAQSKGSSHFEGTKAGFDDVCVVWFAQEALCGTTAKI